jgi:hypothetical protein
MNSPIKRSTKVPAKWPSSLRGGASAAIIFLGMMVTCGIAVPARQAVASTHASTPHESEAAKSEANPTEASTPVVVELFTSEGCSDCPPADRLLYALEQAQPVPRAAIIPLEEHVDYWDSQGWRDPFSSTLYTSRQKDYVYALDLQTAYTPEMVVDGTAEFVGSDKNRAVAAIVKAARVPKANLRIELLPETNSGAGTLHLRVSLAALGNSNPKHGAEVLLAITEDDLESNVTRGENAGAHLSHFGVVRQLRVMGRVDSAGGFSSESDLTPANNWKRENLHVVAFCQDRSTKKILAASTITLLGNPEAAR